VLDACKHIEQLGGTVTYLPVQANGLLCLETLGKAITPQTLLIAVMYGNNETGVVQPIRAVSAIAHAHHVLLFTDATQAVGKTPIDVQAEGIDLLAFSGHKMYGPKGVGALYVRRKNPRVSLTAQMDGGGHERGMRSGTLNVPGIVGLGKACELCLHEMETEARRLSTLRSMLENALLHLPATFVNGSTEHRLPHVSNIAFKNVAGKELLQNLCRTIALSNSSACTSAVAEPSYVLKAMGLNDELAYSSLRFGLGRFTTEAEIDYTIQTVSETVARLRKNDSFKKQLDYDLHH
jgi:cysteine desulfurase